MDGPTFRFVTRSSDPLERLDKVVVAQLAELGLPASRSAVQRWIAAGRVLVDGETSEASARLSVGAEIAVSPAESPPATLAPDASVPFEVVFEDAHLIVVNKPAGVVVHPARGHEEGTLVHGLLARGSFDRLVPSGGRPPTPSVPDLSVSETRGAEGAREPSSLSTGKIALAAEPERSRPGIVHRLDMGTSGILVVAKDEPTREGLRDLFSRHAIERVYLAIAVGHAKTATYDTLHGRHPTDRIRFSSRVREGKRAVTHVRAVESLAEGRATLVACTLETGRTHQIRVHLAEASGTPVLGDPVYGPTPRDPLIRGLATSLGHQALHAAVLGFVHPATGARVRFEREPPDDFRRALESLRVLAPR